MMTRRESKEDMGVARGEMSVTTTVCAEENVKEDRADKALDFKR